MRRTCLTLALVLTLGVSSGAQVPSPTVGPSVDIPAISFEHLTLAATASGIAATTRNPSGSPAAQFCSGLVETADIRIRVDGTAPTASVGSLAQAGATVELAGADTLRRFSAIRTSGTSAGLALTCYASRPSVWHGSLVVVAPPQGLSTTGTGSQVHGTAPTIASPVITGSVSGDATVTGRWSVRESFDQGYFIMQDDATPKSVTDNEINVVFGSPIGIITYHEEVTKTASSFVVADGVLDIKGDNDADNEGVEIRFGSWNTTTEGVIVAGTSGACISASLTNTDISGTDQFFIGWVQNEAFNATNTYTAYSDWSVVGYNATDGSIVSLSEVAGGGTLTDDSTVNGADGDVRLFRSCISAAGVPSAYYSDNGGTTYNTITIVNGVTAHTAGDQMVPFLTFLSAGTDGASPIVNWVQIEALP